MSKKEHEHVHINFKVAVIAVFFFFLLFELHAPVFKPKATGYAPIDSMGHWDKIDRTRGCDCPPGSEFVTADENSCDCFDGLTQKIVTIPRY